MSVLILVDTFKMSRVSKRFYRLDQRTQVENLDRGETAAAENRWVFEVSHEAAHKGKIYLFKIQI